MKKCQPSSHKRSLEGTNLSSQNSFVVLDVECIAALAGDMGVVIPPLEFDKIELLKEIEVARHALFKNRSFPLLLRKKSYRCLV
jgi:hypothetical protein